MAGNLATMFPQTDVPYWSGVFQGRQQDAAMQNNQINQQGALADLLFQQQNDPLKLEQQRLQNQGMGLQNIGQGMKNENDAITLDMRKKAAPQEYETMISDMATKIDGNKMKMFETEIQRMAYSPDPALRKQGTDLMMLHKDVLTKQKEMETKHKMDMDLEALRGRNSKEAAGIRSAGAGGKSTGSPYEDLMGKIVGGKIKKASEIYATAQAALAGLSTIDLNHPDIPKLAAVMQKSQEQAVAEANRGGPQPDLEALGVPTRPAVNFGTPAPGTAAADRPQRQADDDKVIVIDPKGRRGRIPRSQLQEALANGYKESK